MKHRLACLGRAWYSLWMKKGIHPDTYRKVIFEDTASGARFLFGSTVPTAETAKWAKATKGGSPDQYGLGEDGKKYPKTTVEISSKSHPFYTGEDRTLDKAGRVERFKQRAAKKQGNK